MENFEKNWRKLVNLVAL
uniref:Uncharacterized protein n=1 Tax=Arundo donax TaxID=35708 RepID=A0A0A9AAS3_ARUDO